MKLMHNGKVIGVLQDRKLIKSGKQVVLMRSMDGFGMPREIIESNTTTGSGITSSQVKEPSSTSAKDNEPTTGSSDSTRFTDVEIHYLGKVYRASVETFLRHGIHYYRPPFEPQYILPRRFFSVEDPKQVRLV